MRLSYGTRVLRLSLSVKGLDFVQYFYPPAQKTAGYARG